MQGKIGPYWGEWKGRFIFIMLFPKIHSQGHKLIFMGFDSQFGVFNAWLEF